MMPLHTAMAIYGNGGYVRLPSSSRSSRFFGYAYNEVSLSPKCNNTDCRYSKRFHVGEKGNFSSKDGQTNVKGVIRFIGYQKRPINGLCYPCKRFCKCVGITCTLWVYSKSCNKVVGVRI